ncbi:purine and uridine phosphorylase [Apiospora aurea]|uniref:Purine and uridine phosphorylase n=1 Tax=Apiospora aurea TaxID=335848 RepID=A0ABR1QYT3_9PEZI
MPDIEKYTVGWICAVEPEYVAAQEFLDEEHPRLNYQDVNDNNIYTLGRIGEHYIAIACLPLRNYGLVSAANVARDMLRTFTNIRFGLMVGIGGGVPTFHDVRLGDIVVSSIDYEKGAVFQYDFGRTVQDKEFHTTGYQDAPPLFLQAATQDLKVKYRRRGHSIDKDIKDILDHNPRLQEEYCRPTTDRLYRSDFSHAGGLHEKCASSCDETNLVMREPRARYEDNPKIHYGLIASANQVMKDASVRDALAREKGVLCFEMEAAGLMNHFKCLVIRGICDYADSHKNSEWQGYAAMTAAAYAKDLLNVVAPNKILAEKKQGSLSLASCPEHFSSF